MLYWMIIGNYKVLFCNKLVVGLDFISILAGIVGILIVFTYKLIFFLFFKTRRLFHFLPVSILTIQDFSNNHLLNFSVFGNIPGGL